MSVLRSRLSKLELVAGDGVSGRVFALMSDGASPEAIGLFLSNPETGYRRGLDKMVHIILHGSERGIRLLGTSPNLLGRGKR